MVSPQTKVWPSIARRFRTHHSIMKYIGWLVFIVICFPLGQAFHRLAGLDTLGEGGSDDVDTAAGGQKIVVVSGGSRVEVTVDPSSVKAEELPESVTLRRKAEVSSEDGTTVLALESGSKVKVLEKSGSNLTISALNGPLKGIVPVAHTDLLEHVARFRVGSALGSGGPAPKPSAVAANTNPAKSAEAVESAPTEVAQVEEGAVEDKEMADGGDEVAEVSEGGEEEAASADPDSDGPVDIVKLMQESIKAVAIKEFTFDQVEAWEVGPDETIDGVDYQVGLASYKAETIFGVKTVQAKALVRGGKLEKWVYAKTGLEIR